MDAQDILDALFRYFNAYRGYKYQLTNAYVFKWESDFFCLASSGYSYEVEVKISRADFFADFNKDKKHRVLGWEEKQYIKPLGKHHKVKPSLDKWTYKDDGYYHHESGSGRAYRHAKKKPPASKFKLVDRRLLCPNKFAFVVPEGLIQKDEIPQYAGLIYVKDDRRCKPKIIKRPPALHAYKKDFTDTLLKKYYWAYLNSLDRTDIGKNFDFPHKQNEFQTMVRTK